ncbi:nucleotide sugar dehydrogenase [Candidatus Nitrosarchaeum limnium]|uniref:UDP-N-acetyl-D-mannosamine dehydrogenase n=1 Tax=Candidatus Nitrosarchaeum limnium BG20 TaxID=859192 RepID=S2E3C8_9ARCH|nr:nucleotide sugar dehydrogenase [Candidatus Nitrosarchaeum limnium]EPA05323.1 nucleotide sugar dehydrogenase [Candidatus Nitrosarchaeum limnium BG20]
MNLELSKIITLQSDQINSQLNLDSIKVAVVGIGRIGLPTAILFAKSGLTTIGVDINQNLVEKINHSIFPLDDEPGMKEIFNDVIKNKKLIATVDIKHALSQVNVVILSLPTPMTDNNIPDYSSLESVGKQIHDFLCPNSLVIVESTVEPGFIENILIPIIEGQDKKFEAGKSFSIGVCPETANPGEILKDFKTLPRLVGGINNKSSELISLIYSHVFSVDLIQMPNCKTANAVKLTTNVFRDVNIAFVNELALLFEKLGIDIFTVLDAAKRKYNFQVHYPGSGVGGPCLPVNSYQIINSALSNSLPIPKLISVSREINERMPIHTLQLLKDALDSIDKKIIKSTIGILGVSYKPNVKDIQLAPAEKIISELKSLECNIKIFDPYFISTDVFSIRTEQKIEDMISNSDAILILTAHQNFFSINPEIFNKLMKKPIVIDTRGIFDITELNRLKIIYRGIGRPY